MIDKFTQYIFYFGDESKSYHKWIPEYAKLNKMMNMVERRLKKYAHKDQLPYPHPQHEAAGLVLPSVMGIKNHRVTVHKMFCVRKLLAPYFCRLSTLPRVANSLRISLGMFAAMVFIHICVQLRGRKILLFLFVPIRILLL